MRNRFVVVGLLGTVLTVACGSQDLSNGGTSDGAVAADGTAGAGGYAPFTPESSGGVRSTGGAGGTGGTAGIGTGGAGGSATPIARGGSGSGGIAGANGAAGAAGGRGAPVGGRGGPPPAGISSFVASPATIVVGQSSTLSWMVTGASTLSIDQGIGSVLGSTSVVVAPSQTTTYTLTFDGSVSRQMTVTVIPAGFWATGSMTVARTNHTATLLSNGKVLIAGGYDGTKVLASAELYDPAAGTFTATGSMTTARRWHTATLLPNGMVLIVSGSRAELYDPNTGTFMATGSSTVSRIQHTATLLQSGMVLITGGTDGTNALASAELYDPAAGTLTATGNLTVTRYQHAATLLQSGMVLVAGGFVPPTAMYQTFGLTSAELYDPKAGVFTATGDMGGWNSSPIATLLLNGQVLMGGDAMSFEGIISDPTLELYDPAARTFAFTGRMSAARACYTMTLLPSGLVLIAGGYDGGGNWGSFLASVELYDPGTGTCTATGGMATEREFHTATLLPNGTVLVAGGDGGSVLASAELYK